METLRVMNSERMGTSALESNESSENLGEP